MFQRRQRQSRTLSDLPVGTFIKTEQGYFYVFSNKYRYRFTTTRVLDSWSPHRVVVCSELDPAVAKLTVLTKMKFRNGSLLYCQANGKMYLVSENKLRQITDPFVLDQIGAKREDAVWVSLDEINLHEMGEPLN